MTGIPPGPQSPPPARLPVSVHDQVRVLEGGRLLVGGSPLGVLRLTEGGARVVTGWSTPAPIGEEPERRALARRLLDRDILIAQPSAEASGASVTIVVPVRDRTAKLERCLDRLLATCPDSPMIVVDDGSQDHAAVLEVCGRRKVHVIRHREPRGAAGARNTGLAASSTSFVAFVDSDVVVPDFWIEALLAHFQDPCVAAVAPRIRALGPTVGPIARYEERHSPLDMGDRGGSVGPGRPTPYIPSAVLMVRRPAVGGGFDADLDIGEDVDLVWRLTQAGWRVLYVPGTHVWHDHRVRLRAFVSRRRVYACSVAPLSLRHPAALPAVRINVRTGLPWMLSVLGYPRQALIVAAGGHLLFAQKLTRATGCGPYRLAGALFTRGLLAAGLGLAQATRRAWAPLLLPLSMRHARIRRLLLVALAVPIVQDAADARRPRTLPGDAAVRFIDEIVASLGTWEGCIRHRTIRPLLPSLRAFSPGC